MGIGVYDVIINLAGASIAEGKWTEITQKRNHGQPYSDATAACVKYINNSPKKPKRIHFRFRGRLLW